MVSALVNSFDRYWTDCSELGLAAADLGDGVSGNSDRPLDGVLSKGLSQTDGGGAGSEQSGKVKIIFRLC